MCFSPSPFRVCRGHLEQREQKESLVHRFPFSIIFQSHHLKMLRVCLCVSAFHVLLSRSVLQQHVLYYSVKYLNILTHFTNILSLGFRPSVVFYREETRQCTSCTLQLCDCWIQILSSDDGFALKLSKLTPKLRGRCLIIVGLNSRRQSLYSTVVLKEITPCLVC